MKELLRKDSEFLFAKDFLFANGCCRRMVWQFVGQAWDRKCEGELGLYVEYKYELLFLESLVGFCVKNPGVA